MRHGDDHHRITRSRTTTGLVGIVGVLALILSACGDPEGEAGAAESPVVEEAPEQEPAPEPPAEDLEETEGAEDEEPAPPPEDEEPAPEEAGEEAPVEPADTERCQIAIGDDSPMDPDDYDALVMPINGSLEELAYALDAALTDLEEGGDGPSLEVELEQHAQTWEDLVEPVQGITPPDGAEDWHDSLADSWVLVCEAIEDGIAGSADGDDERFESFVDALRDFPSLVNHLHSNAACGPFESC
jgi:hypothetical protein